MTTETNPLDRIEQTLKKRDVLERLCEQFCAIRDFQHGMILNNSIELAKFLYWEYVSLVQAFEQQREEIALLQNAVKLHAPGWKLKCNSKDIDPATYANLIDCDVCYNVHLKPKCEKPA